MNLLVYNSVRLQLANSKGKCCTSIANLSKKKKKNRSSQQSCSINNYVLGKIHRKHPCQSLLCNKVAVLRPATLYKKRLWLRCFPVSFAKFSRIPFLIEHFRWLLLYGSKINDKIVAGGF